MIKFFRKIRYNLMETGKTGLSAETSVKAGKYLKYAIGEIILVMIGILLALQVNNWNEHRKAKIEESNFYGDLLLDLEKDEQKLEYFEKFALKRIEYLDTLLTYSRNPSKSMGINMFGMYIEPIYYTEQPTIYDSSFESAKSAGTFSIISDKTLLKDLSEYYSDFDQLKNIFNSIERFVENQFEPMMYNLPEGYIDESTGNLVINQSDVSDFYKKIASIQDNRNIEHDYNGVLRHPNMENYLIGDMGRTFNVLGKIKFRQKILKELKQKIKNRD